MIDKNKTLELANTYYSELCQDVDGENSEIHSRQVKAALFALIDAINENMVEIPALEEKPLHQSVINLPLILEQNKKN